MRIRVREQPYALSRATTYADEDDDDDWVFSGYCASYMQLVLTTWLSGKYSCYRDQNE